VQIGSPPEDFPFRLAGFTDIAAEDFVYAKTPGGGSPPAAVHMHVVHSRPCRDVATWQFF